MKKTSTLFTPLNDSVEVNTANPRLKPSAITIAKLRQLARCAFATGRQLPPIMLN